MWEITPYVNTHGFLRELTRFIVTDGGNRKKIIRYGIYNNWNNIQETLLLLNDKRAVNAIHEAHENHKNGILNKGKTIEEIFTDV